MERTHSISTKRELDARLRRIGRLVHHGPGREHTPQSPLAPPPPTRRAHRQPRSRSPRRLAAPTPTGASSSVAAARSRSCWAGAPSAPALSDGPWLLRSRPEELVDTVTPPLATGHLQLRREGVERVGLVPVHPARVGTSPECDPLVPGARTLLPASPLVAFTGRPPRVSRARSRHVSFERRLPHQRPARPRRTLGWVAPRERLSEASHRPLGAAVDRSQGPRDRRVLLGRPQKD